MGGPEAHRPKVAIIGAGLTGLLTAQGLKKNGFDVTIFDKEAAVDARTRDWTIVIHWAMPMMAKMLPEEVLQQMPTAICNPHLDFTPEVESFPCYNGVTGEILFRSPMPGSRRVSRLKFRQILAQGLDVRWGKALTGLSTTDSGPVKLTFDGGDTFEADYVLGADGASSKMRELLLGDAEAARPRGSGFMFATGIVKYGDAAKVEALVKTHPVAAITMGKDAVGGGGVLYVDDPNDMATWTVFWIKIWRGEPVNLQGQAAIDYIKDTTKGMCEPFQSLIDWTPPGSTCYIDEMKYWLGAPFDNRGGRVTLAGDAAHPMLIYRGQGFQHAIIDASNYLDALLKIDHLGGSAEVRQEVMAAHDAEMIERGTKAVKQSLQEAEYSMDLKTVANMLMVKQGHGRSA